MGEIKSTLELVLEKTKHLSLSKYEKQQHTQNEVKKLFKGLLQKYKDQKINKDQLKKEYSSIKKLHNIADDKQFLNEALSHININDASPIIINLLEEMFSKDINRLASVYTDLDKEKLLLKKRIGDQFLAQLKELHNISGSAVIPNLDNNDAWLKNIAVIYSRFEKILDKEKKLLAT